MSVLPRISFKFRCPGQTTTNTLPLPPMSDIIRLLPDAIANQIAAGEVIQRPASVVKELMENAIDAGATRIQLILKDAGKSLIQIIDNGTGMSETDARMAFERHATSKIRKSEDLQTIRTMGFRGEALASMAAVAQVEMKTRLHDRELGSRILIAGSQLIKQEPVQTPGGTSFSVANLFFNVPARRKFLKSDPAELRNIIEEFEHIALAYPEIEMSCIHNDSELYILPKGNVRQRIVSVFGKNMGEKIIAVEEETDLVNIAGFIGKVEACKKKRGEQYLFVNRRFIRSTYLHHAIRAAYESLIAVEDHPFYVLYLDIDPGKIDVNVHPSKHEIKFLDERIIYQYIRVATRHALGQYVPLSLDFESIDKGFSDKMAIGGSIPSSGSVSGFSSKLYAPPPPSGDWRRLYEGLKTSTPDTQTASLILKSSMDETAGDQGGELVPSRESAKEFNSEDKLPYQLHLTYIITPITSGFLLIDQQASHQRILYDRSLKQMNLGQTPSQHSLFPTTIQLSGSDHHILKQLLPDLQALGFELESFGSNAFIVQGMPMDWIPTHTVQSFVESILKAYLEESDQKSNHKNIIAKHIARYQSIQTGQRLSTEEMQFLIDQLFACDDHAWSPFGSRCYTTIGLDEIIKRLK
ncbi:MAG: DNA mismatch repair endonuclease MutL [Saprospiraceae bacterium]